MNHPPQYIWLRQVKTLRRKSKLGINLLGYVMLLPLCFITALRENKRAKCTRVSDSGGTSASLNPVLSCLKGPTEDRREQPSACLPECLPPGILSGFLLKFMSSPFTSPRLPQISKDTCAPFTFLYCQWPHRVSDANLVLRCPINIYRRNIWMKA